MAKVKVGVVGAGSRAQTHYSSLAEMDDVEIAALCDLNEGRLKYTGDRYGIKDRFRDYKRMLKEVDLDALYIIMQPSYLDPILTYCLEEGKDIFIEKPPGISVEQTRKWAEIAERNNCKTMVCFQRRFHPIAVEAKRLVEERSKILYCVAAFHKLQLLTPMRVLEVQMQRRRQEGDKVRPEQLPPSDLPSRITDWLTSDIIHAVDLLLWMGGEVNRVRSIIGQLYADPQYFDPLHINLWIAALEFKTGGVGLLCSNRTAGGRALYFEMHGKAISAYGNIPGMRGVDSCLIQKDDESYDRSTVVKNEQLIGSNAAQTHLDGTFQANRHFIDCIKEGRVPDVNFKVAVKTMEVIREIPLGQRLYPVF